MSPAGQADPPSVSGPTLTQRLREDTHARHMETEAAVDLASRARSIEGYAELLGGFARFHAFVISGIADVLALASPQLREGLRRREAHYDQDLRTLGRPVLPGPGDVSVNRAWSLDHQLGAWYVLEGAALGGTVIARHVRETLPEAAGALSYLTGDARGIAARWHSFQDFANGLEVAGVVECVAVCRGAERTFAAFASIAHLG